MFERDDEVPLIPPTHQRASVVRSQWSVTRKPLPPGTISKYEELRGSPDTEEHSGFEKSKGIGKDEQLAPKSFKQDPSWHKWYCHSLTSKLRKLGSTSHAWYKKNLSPTIYKLESRRKECYRKYLDPTLHKLEPVWFGCQVKYVASSLRKLELWWHEGYSKYLAPRSEEGETVALMWHRQLKHCGVFLVLATVVSLSLYWLGSVYQMAKIPPGDSIRISGMLFSIPSCLTGKPGAMESFFVGIDIPIGKLSFAQAKTVDLAWNWIAGRGIQSILVLLCYRVFADVLMRITEVHHIQYDTFTSLAIYSTKLDTMMQFGKTLFRTPGWRVKFTMAWLLISTAYLATFPSLMDIMSGYEASYLSQLNLPNNASKVMNGTVLSEFDYDYYYDYYGSYPIDSPSRLPITSFFNSTLANNVTYGNHSSQSAYPYVYHWYDHNLDTDWSGAIIINQSYSYTALYENSSGIWYAHKTKELFMEQPEHYSCVIDPNIYHWGFSAGWIITVACVNSAWLIGLWIIWVDADHNSQLCRKGRRMGVYRGMVDISEAIREDLGTELCAYSEEELAAAVQRQSPIKYYVSNVEDGQPGHIGLSSRQSAKVKLRWDQKYGSQLRARKSVNV